MSNFYFRLDDYKRPLPVDSSDQAGWERIGEYRSQKWYVSTVFLGVNVNTNLKAVPIVFETLVENLNDVESRELYRFTTYAEAELFHRAVVFMVSDDQDLVPPWRLVREKMLEGGPLREWIEIFYIQVGQLYTQVLIKAEQNKQEKIHGSSSTTTDPRM